MGERGLGSKTPPKVAALVLVGWKSRAWVFRLQVALSLPRLTVLVPGHLQPPQGHLQNLTAPLRLSTQRMGPSWLFRLS